jgi:hypothetical protein
MIEEALLKSNYIGKDGFSWWIGQIAKKDTWEKGSQFSNKGDWAARCKVRIVGHHTFDGNVLADADLPWAQIMLDPSFGSTQGGIGGTINLKGGETCFGFFLDGDDGQQPVVIGLLYRSDGVKNLQTEDVVTKEKSSRFKPFTGHPGNNPPNTQRNIRGEKEIDQNATTEERNQQSAETTSVSKDSITDTAFSADFGFNFGEIPNRDILAGTFKNIPAFSTNAIGAAFSKRPAFVKTNGCQNNLIGQITQGLQDFIAFTNGLDKYLNTYIDPVLNEIVDIGNSIRNCARQIGGIVKLIINNLRNTIFKCIVWAFRKLVGLVIPPPQQTIVLEVMKKILDVIFCILEKLPGNIIGFIEGMLGDLAANTINAPVCAVEQWTAGILAKVMDSIDNVLSDIMSGIGWLTDGLSTVSGILNQASSLASQIFSFLECTGLACETPSVWAANFGPSEKEADDWNKMVGSVNVFKGVSDGLGSIEDALYETPLYAGINGRFNNIFNKCNQKVINPTNQNDIIPLPDGSKYKNCIPPIVRIVGDGVGASAVPIVDSKNSIFSVEIVSGGVGYTKATVSIVDNTGHGSGAYAKAIVKDGSVSSIYLTDTGSGYCPGNYTNLNPEPGIGTTGTGGTGSGIGTTGTGGTGPRGIGPGIGTTRPGIGRTTNPGISSQVSGIVRDIVPISPGYGYTNGDTISDGKNTYTPIVTPGSGAIIGVNTLTNPIGGFDRAPTLTINTRTGVAANLVPIMRYTPVFNTINNQTAISGIVTSVIDCV